MPTIRKISPADSTDWELDFAPFVLDALLARVAGADRTGLTRIDRPGADGGEHAWRARVYVGSSEIHRQFADSLHGGAEQALRRAIAWRNAMRQTVDRPRRSGRTWRVVRAEYDRNRGYLAYADRRRYFADGKYGGPVGAQRAAESWIETRRLAQQEGADLAAG